MNEKKYLLGVCAMVLLTTILACSVQTAGPAINPAATSESAIMPTVSESTITPTVNVTTVKLTLVTGSDGTADNPIFELADINFVPLFTATLDNPGDLQPGQTDVYEFSVPFPFCQIAGWKLTKPSASNVDDPWLATEIYIEMNGIMVFFDRSSSSLGLITASSERSGNWSGIEIFTQHCQN